MSSKTTKVFQVMGLPKVTSFAETGIKAAGLRQANKAITNAPQVGKLVVSGVSSPVMQGLFEQGRKVAAIDFFEMFNAKFTDDSYPMPPAKEGQVTLIYRVAMEPVKDFGYSAKLLQGLINTYSAMGLVIIETHLTPATFNMQYQTDFQNKLVIPPKKEEQWA